MVEVVHVEGEVGQHHVVELIEMVVFFGVLAVYFSEHITEDHQHASLVKDVLDFAESLFYWEEVEGLSHGHQVEVVVLLQLHDVMLLKHDLVGGVGLAEFLDVVGGHVEHVLADVDSLGLLEAFAEAEKDLACADRDIEVLLSVDEGVQGFSAEFLGVLGSEFLIIHALGGEVPDVHTIVSTVMVLLTIGVQTHDLYFQRPQCSVKIIRFYQGTGMCKGHVAALFWLKFSLFWHFHHIGEYRFLLKLCRKHSKKQQGSGLGLASRSVCLSQRGEAGKWLFQI